jgi:hypothetical protein
MKGGVCFWHALSMPTRAITALSKRHWGMTTAAIAVKGSASDEFPADVAIVHFTHQLTAGPIRGFRRG